MSAWTRALRSAHWAAQVVSAAGATLTPPRDDVGHTNLAWSDELAALVGTTLPDGRAAALRLDDATLLVTGGDLALPLEGRTIDEATSWLGEQLGAELSLPVHEMPERPARLGQGSDELAGWMALAHRS